jgi:hypothetical protein
MADGEEEKLDGEIADADQGLENRKKGQSDDAEPEEEEKTSLDKDDDQTEHDEDWYENEYLEESDNVKKKKKWKYAIFAALLGVIAAAGFLLWFMNDRNWKLAGGASPTQQAEPIKNNEKPKALDASFSPQETHQPETTVPTKTPEPTAFGLADKLEKATRLRDTLLKKQEEIQALKHYYRNRIQEVRDEILMEKREKGITTFQQALKSKRIELGLRTIRRRHLYINKLNGPLEQLHGGSEELLYIERLAGIQIQMAPVVNGIDIAKLGKRMDFIIEKKTREIDNLAIDTKKTRAPALEKIWEEIVQQENANKKSEKQSPKGKKPKKEKVHFQREDKMSKKSEKQGPKEEKPKKEKAHSQRQHKINMEIWKEICVGDLSRKYELTKLSLNATRCLAQWEGRDLFLNGITELPASIAEQLSQWEGEWLCLNHLTELSPEAAEGLSRWRGIRLSLNGLIELTPQAAKHLSQWRGKQMEVVGLANISPEANKYLTVWQKAGGEIIFR